jgi:hypothetical protein
MPVNDTDHTDRARIDLVIDRVWKSVQQQPAQASSHDGEALGRFLDAGERNVHRVEKITGRVRRARAIPLERLINLGPRADPNDERGHLAQPGAELVAKRGPRNAGVGIRIGLRFAAI